MNKTLKVYQIINVNARIKNVIEGDSAINAAFKFKLLNMERMLLTKRVKLFLIRRELVLKTKIGKILLRRLMR